MLIKLQLSSFKKHLILIVLYIMEQLMTYFKGTSTISNNKFSFTLFEPTKYHK
jgi:hypothetical protein